MSAAFSSRSAQHQQMKQMDSGVPVGAYDPHSATSMAAQAAKTHSRKPMGSFGASARNLDWGRTGSDSMSARGGMMGPTSDETAEVRSTFGSARASKGPSAAMGAGNRFGPTKEASGGDYYVPPALGESNMSKGNRRSSMFGTSKRFSEVKVSAAGDYSDAKPGAFASASKKVGRSNTGFGGTSARRSTFGEAAKRAEENASSHLSYDGALKGTSAFAKASEQTNKPSAAFSSKSSQRTAAAVPEGPGAQQYNTASVNSLAQGANKSFNKSLQQGTGGFGSSSRRTSGVMGQRPSDVPGPGEYAPDISDAETGARSARPSSAFASTTRKDVAPRSADVPSSGDYDAYAGDGMAAQATRTFNKKASTGGFGSRAVRQIHAADKETPGPGEYEYSDPHRPTVDSGLKAGKGKGTGAFASTTLRDSAQWNTAGRDSGYSSFLP